MAAASSPRWLVFNGTDGANPEGALTMDASSNIFGVEEFGGEAGDVPGLRGDVQPGNAGGICRDPRRRRCRARISAPRLPSTSRMPAGILSPSITRRSPSSIAVRPGRARRWAGQSA